MATSALHKATSALTNPTVTGILHYLLTKSPPRIRLPLLIFLYQRLSAANVERLIRALKIVWLVGLAGKISHKLNAWALNNWRWRAQKAGWVWDWEIAVVTGGCSGIGREITRELAGNGVKVAVLDVQELPAELARNSKVTLFHCDLTSPSSIAEAAKKVRMELGDPTILVNNAGVAKPHSILNTSNEYVTEIFQVNTISHFWTVKEFLPHMIKKNKGHVVGIASAFSFTAAPGVVEYCATKASVMAFHEGLGQEIKHVYKAPGVLNTIVHPSWVDTPLLKPLEGSATKKEAKVIMPPEPVAKEIVNHILSCRGGQLIIPKSLRYAAAIRGLPNWVQELLRDANGRRTGKDFVHT